MNAHERDAWNRLIALGAERIELGGKRALDLRTARPRTADERSDFIGAVLNVTGRSGRNRWHVDRRNNPVFVVTDDLDTKTKGRRS